jgi:Asp-tRNA(Asn)/Glu-tRNA(Gln) amidotransferase A subunit family amidase
MQAQAAALMQDFDALIAPTVAILGPLINFLDGCALTIPCRAPGSLPVGLLRGTDRRVLQAGGSWRLCDDRPRAV